MITENVSTLKIHRLTQEQYDRELAAGRLDANAIYLTPDEGVDFTGYATEEYVNQATEDLKNEILGGAGEAVDTLKELADLIAENQGTIDILEDIATGKADKEHTHEIEEVNGLQDALDAIDGKFNAVDGKFEDVQDEFDTVNGEIDNIKTTLNGKAEAEHGLHVEFSDVAPTMAGEAFAGVALTVARSDHRHATDTTRASVDDLNSAVNRIQTVETKQDNFLECGEEDILAMFA